MSISLHDSPWVGAAISGQPNQSKYDIYPSQELLSPIMSSPSMPTPLGRRSAVEEEHAQLFELLKLQRADGLFIWSDLLIEHLEDSQSLDGDPASPLWVTERVISLLEDDFSDYEDLWGHAVEKAKRRLSALNQ